MKKLFIPLILLMFLTGCSNKEEASILDKEIEAPVAISNLKVDKEEEKEVYIPEIKGEEEDLDVLDIKDIADSKEFVEFREENTEKDISYIVNNFNWKYLSSLENTSDNIIYSPVSLSSFLGVLVNCTDGQVLRESLDDFGVSSLENLNDSFYSFSSYLRNSYDEKYRKMNFGTFLAINTQKIERGYLLDENLKFLLLKNFNGYLNEYDFKFNKLEANDKINSFIYDNTDKHFNKKESGINISEEETFNIYNSSSFYGSWNIRFNHKKTNKGNFTSVSGESTVKDFMTDTRNSSEFRFYEDDKYQGIGIPYVESLTGAENTYFIGIIPKGDSLDIKSLWDKEDFDYKENFIKNILESPKYFDKVTLYLPLFSFNESSNFIENLENSEFNYLLDNGSLNKIYKDYPISISNIDNFIYFKITEEGGDLIDDISLDFGEESQISKEIEIKFDRPFLFTVIDTNYNVELITGILNN